ncbi:helix-turn-helix domain-containing protein [Halomonas sp. M1]|uniref:helix-turn-helix domain-containing protein n=1 Tax=Halomonas sp. M1 TaxID=3035470 RepID=UPI002485C3A5|nr:helix-turn-helix domain-containing protein [Halomonas sp. M1]WFE73074.1 helix-turn-helix domain-containing protein [Halomonas sp. M1]
MNNEIPINPTQRWEWLKYQLRSQGSSLRKLSDELGVTGNAVQLVKYTPYPRMERAIAKKLGLAPHAVWPERWNHDGTPCRERPNRAEKLSSKRTTANAQNRLCDKDSGSNVSAHRQMAQGA